jgi:hypothetical protein
MSIEVLDQRFSASSWKAGYGDALTESALTHGAQYWEWHEHSWGVVFEVAFPDEDRWEVFRNLPSVRAALDAVPDPVNGLLIYRGRGGSAGRPQPRPPRPLIGAGEVELPEPEPELPLRLQSEGTEDPIG